MLWWYGVYVMKLMQPSQSVSPYSFLPENHRPTSKPVFSNGAELDYFSGRVFCNIQYANNIDPEIIVNYSWQHPDQASRDVHIDGNGILEYLVQGFDSKNAEEYSTFICLESDQIQYHFGVKALEFIRNNWNNLPREFISWVSRHRLYAASDTFWGNDGEIYIPCLNGLSGHPIICGHSPRWLTFDKKDLFLRG